MATLKELITLGKQCFDNKEYPKAEKYFNKAISINPNYADLFHMLGVIKHAEGKFSSALDMFKKAIKINPNYTEALLNTVVLLNDLGHYKEAQKIYSKLQRGPAVIKRQIEPVLRGKLSNLHSDIGDIYSSIGFHNQAIDEYKKALLLNPTYLDIKTKLGKAYRESGQIPHSLKELKAIKTTNPNYYTARVQLGLTLYSFGKITEAKKEWKSVITKDPNNEYAKMYLRLCKAQKKPQKKIKKAKK